MHSRVRPWKIELTSVTKAITPLQMNVEKFTKAAKKGNAETIATNLNEYKTQRDADGYTALMWDARCG